VVDDVHRLAGRGPAQQFLLGAIDALVRRGALVLLTLRQAPQATSGLMPRLASRLAGGLVVRVHPPGLEARRQIVRDVAHTMRLSLDDDAVVRLADDVSHLPGTAANLRGVVMSAAAQHDIGSNHADQPGKPKSRQKPSGPKLIWQGVTSAVGKQFGFSISQLKGKSRRKTIAEARGLAMHLLRQLTGASYAEIGRYFGGRDHTTVLHACQKLTSLLAKDDAMRRLADELAFQVSSDGPP
jgi:chromosomal replication initiator protein